MYHYFRSSFPSNAHTEKLLPGIRAAAEEYLEKPVEALRYSEYKLYHKIGSRVEYEASYIAHRRRANVFTVMALAEDAPKWLEELEDILWAVCDEYTWALPAHVSADYPTEDAVTRLDLFACETGAMLADVMDLLGDRLSVEVYNRVVYELRRRIIVPFLTTESPRYGNNWSAICGGCPAMVAMRLGTAEEAAEAIRKADELMANFLTSYHDDGCCLEGPLYWRYGFGFFCYYAAMARDYTGGANNWFAQKKVRSVAEFCNKFYLQDNHVIPFADASHDMYFHIGLSHFLAKEYGSIAQPDEKFELLFDDDPRHRSAELIRDFYWHDPDLKVCELSGDASFDLPDAKWYIRRNGKTVFATKGGHNLEPHNHNDVGSFFLFDDNRYILDDLGWPEYDKWYFTEKRPEYLCSGSHGHNLPIIGGNCQKPGREREASVLSVTADQVAYDISAAYDLSGVTVRRTLTFRDGKLLVADTFTGCRGMEIRERFVTRLEPVLTAETAAIENWTITADRSCRVEHSTDTFEPRLSCCKQDMKSVETAHLIDFVATPNADTWTVTFSVGRK